MKKSLLLLHILIFAWMQIAPTQVLARDGAESTERLIQPMPKNYVLPDMLLVDTVAYLYKFKDEIGKRVDVEGIVGRYGGSWGNDFKRKIYEIESQYEGKIEIILTLSSTMADAEILKKQMEKNGKKMVIVSIPDWLQERMLASAPAEIQKQFNSVSWNPGMPLQPLPDPTIPKTMLTRATNILKNQYVKPSNIDIKIAVFSAAAAGVVSTVGLIGVGGIDPGVIAAISLAKALFTGSTAAFSKTIGNVLTADLSNEFSIVSGIRKVASDVGYALGTGAAFGSYGATQVLIDSTNTVLKSLTDKEKNKKLSDQAKRKLIWYTFSFGTTMSLLSALGVGSQLVIDYGYIKYTAIELASLVVTGVLFFIYKYDARRMERLAQMPPVELLKVKLGKVMPPLASRMNAAYILGSTFPPSHQGNLCSSLFK